MGQRIRPAIQLLIGDNTSIRPRGGWRLVDGDVMGPAVRGAYEEAVQQVVHARTYDNWVVVTVTRTSDKDVQHRQIIVSIDGEAFATLMYGQSASKEIAPGKHTIKAYNTLVWKTMAFEIAEGQDVEFSVINLPGKWTFPLVALIGAGPIYVGLERTK